MASDVEELGKAIGLGMRKQQNMQQTMTKPGTLSTYFLMPTYRVKIQTTRCKVEYKSIGDAFILGHSDNAILGTSELGAGTMGSWTEVETLYDIQDITNYGKNYVRDWLYSGNDYPNYIIVGGGDTAFSTDQTNLITPIGITDEDSSDNSTDAIGIIKGEFKSTDYYALEKFPITNGLVSWWRMNEKVGTTIKDSFGTNTGTSANNASTMTVAGKVGNALDFNGSDDYVTIGNSTSLDFSSSTGLTVSCWVKINNSADTTRNFLVSKHNGGANGTFFLEVFNPSTNTVTIKVMDTDTGTQNSVVESTVTINDGAWHHIVGVANVTNTSMQLYIDGVQKQNVSKSLLSSGIKEEDIPVVFGQFYNAGAYNSLHLNGALDEVCIFNRALSATEVTALYDSSLLAYGQAIKEVGVVAGGRTKHTIDTTKGGAKVDVTINTEA